MSAPDSSPIAPHEVPFRDFVDVAPHPPFLHAVLLMLGLSTMPGLHAFTDLATVGSISVLVPTGTVLLSGVGLARWVWMMVLARRHPFEPWRWERRWRLESSDEQFIRVLSLLPTVVVGLAALGLFHALYFWGGFQEVPLREYPLLFGAVLLAVDAAFVYFALFPFVLGVLRLLRFGRTRLALPGIPLALGSRVQVEWLAPLTLAELPAVNATLRRVHERRERRRSSGGLHSSSKTETRVVRTVEYEKSFSVETGSLRDTGRMVIPLTLPPPERLATTSLVRGFKRFWELQLVAERPGLDVDVTFRIPVYQVRFPSRGD